jgi:hypothetical protein
MLDNEPDRPTYPFPPIGSRAALAKMLKCTIEQLARMEQCADNSYREVQKQKKNGKVRLCYDAAPQLKAIQGRIKCMILKKVKYPAYLTGGIADPERPRDYIRNAQIHAGWRVLVNEDIESFFPSISAALVHDIWRHFFHFPEEVARTLTTLTTRKGELPQGAKTSNHLANLAFWSSEPNLERDLRSSGFRYTRYIDDITISSKTDRTPQEIGDALSQVASMLKRHGLRLNRRKHRICYAGQSAEVTGLHANEHSASLPREKRSAIRAQVHACEKEAMGNTGPTAFTTLMRRASSLVGQFTRLHPNQGNALRKRLKAIRAG